MMKKQALEGEILEEEKNTAPQLSLEEINQKIINLQSKETETDDILLEDFNLNQLNEEMQELFKQSEAIMNSTSAQAGDIGWGTKMLKLLPYGDKLIEKGQEKILENSSLKSIIDGYCAKADKIKNDAVKNRHILEDQVVALEEEIEESEKILTLINQAIKNLSKEDASRKEKNELFKWQTSKVNLEGIIQSNKMTLESLDLILNTTQALEMRVSQFNPIIKKFIKQRAKLATQNVRNQLINSTHQVGITLLNELQTRVQADTHQITKDGIDIMTSPIVQVDTLKTMRKELVSFHKDLNNIFKEKAKNFVTYNNELAQNKLALEKHSSENHLSLTFDETEKEGA